MELTLSQKSWLFIKFKSSHTTYHHVPIHSITSIIAYLQNMIQGHFISLYSWLMLQRFMAHGSFRHDWFRVSPNVLLVFCSYWFDNTKSHSARHQQNRNSIYFVLRFTSSIQELLLPGSLKELDGVWTKLRSCVVIRTRPSTHHQWLDWDTIILTETVAIDKNDPNRLDFTCLYVSFESRISACYG